MRAHVPNGTSIGSAVFAQMTVECRYTFQRFALAPLKIAPSHEGIRTHVTSGSLGPPESSTKRYLDRFCRFCREMPGITSVAD